MTACRRSRLAVNSCETLRLPPVVTMARRSASSRLWSTKYFASWRTVMRAKRMRVQVVQHQDEQAALVRTSIGRDVGRDGAWPASVARDRDVDHRKGRDVCGWPSSKTSRSPRREVADETPLLIDHADIQLHGVDVRAKGRLLGEQRRAAGGDSEQGGRGPVDRLHVGADYSGESTEVAEDTDKQRSNRATETKTERIRDRSALRVTQDPFWWTRTTLVATG